MVNNATERDPRMSGRRLLPWFALGFVVIVAVVVLVVRSQPDNSPTARADRLGQQLACPVCDGQSVADSNSPQSRSIREDIPRRIAVGQSDAEIRAYYVSKYGERVLETPSNSGLGLVAWGLPALAVILGAVSIFVAVRRWSNTPRLAATDEDEDIVRREREREREADEDDEQDDE
jgi:cytochrome c-type biogenesis protein CcmH